MTADQRRSDILQILSCSASPISAGTLAGRFNVSRQVVVGDIALLRAGGASIDATPRGYVMRQSTEPAGMIRRIACRHTAKDMERELNMIVDNGCAVLDVIVDHPIYGQLTGTLELRSRYDVSRFVERAAEAQPLSALTEGIHLHTLSCPDESSYRRVIDELAEAGILLQN